MSTYSNKLTTCNALLGFSNHLAIQRKESSTVEAYCNDMRIFLTFIKNNYSHIRYISQITNVHIANYRKFLDTQVRNGIYKETTRCRKYEVLRAFYNYAEAEYKIPNLAKGFRYSRATTNLINVLDQKTLIELVNCAKNDCHPNSIRDYALLTLLRTIGCRRCSVLALKWTDVSFTKNEITINHLKTKNASVLSMSIDLSEALAELYRVSDDKLGFVFISRQGNRMSTTAFNSVVSKYAKKSGLQALHHFDITATTFRHSFITHCIKQNVSLEKIRRFTGHKSNDSLIPYVNLVSEDLKSVSALF